MITNGYETIKKFPEWNDIEIKELAGYKNYNFLIKSKRGKFVFKMYPFDVATSRFLEAETGILLNLNKETGGFYPLPIPLDGSAYIKSAVINGQKYLCRILTFLEGEFIGKLPLTAKLMSSFGNFLAKLDLKLIKIENTTIKSVVNEWDIQHLSLNEKLFKYIGDPDNRKTVEYFYNAFFKYAYPYLEKLPKQIIHNDANEWNTLTKNGMVSSIIDFGDMVYSQRINEAAIAIAYSCFNTDEPLKRATDLIKSYHEIFPLNRTETKILYYLIAARLITSVSHSAYSKKSEPDNSHRFISEKPAWRLLYKLKEIEPDQAADQFERALF